MYHPCVIKIILKLVYMFPPSFKTKQFKKGGYENSPEVLRISVLVLCTLAYVTQITQQPLFISVFVFISIRVLF